MTEKTKSKLPSDRAKKILSAIIDNYIEEGVPIGSKKLATYDRFDLSPATIRNVMSDLENLGFLSSPHTSCLLYTSPSPRDATLSRMPSCA